MKKIIGIVALCCIVTLAYGQRTMEGDTTWINLQTNVKSRALKARKRVEDFSKANNVPVKYYTYRGEAIVMVDVSETGMPIYKTVDNANAAITTGVTELRQGGDLGLNLQGENMTVAVWDGGIVKAHIETVNRILSVEGSTESTHATHVTGTILATGINTKAKGMAPLAKAYTYDFDDDESEMASMARPDQSGVILSNHSYGVIAGWQYDGASWQWYGDPSISTEEDYKFGFYSQAARTWDQIAYNSPYYTICKSAGNDRTDRGPATATRPADCNSGSGYDCIADASAAKNIITVGAVDKVLSYTGPGSVKMSTFSSWGPTDDGRIKPDLVADGVSIFSLSADGDDQYTTLSGTSMASPNATGSLLLVQQLAKRLRNGNVLKASTLKSLAIHTAKEAGAYPGPDYAYGWGLLDVAAASKVLLSEDGMNNFVVESDLANGKTYDIALDPKQDTKITATLVWTDPAGSPVSAKLDPTNVMLVNDLDLSLFDAASNTVYPWILDPTDPTKAASKGNNVRDNVEKIEFENPLPRRYTLRVSHKGTLTTGHQNFSLIITYSSANDNRVTYYWIGNSGNWDNPAKWSLTSGGATANVVPGVEDKVVFDENSFTANGATVTLNGAAACASFTWLSQRTTTLNINGQSLTVGGNFIITSPGLKINKGVDNNIIFTGSANPESQLSFAGNNLGGNLRFINQNAVWNWHGNANVSGIELVSGTLNINESALVLDSLKAGATAQQSTLNLKGTVLNGFTLSVLDGHYVNLVAENTTINTTGNSRLRWDNITFSGTLNVTDEATLIGNSHYDKILIQGELLLAGSNTIARLGISGVGITMSPGDTQTITDSLGIQSSIKAPIVLKADAGNPAVLNFTNYSKWCFNYLSIENINVTGNAIINAGTNSTLVNSSNWLQKNCNEVLYAKFTSAYHCLGARTEFTNISEGNAATWHWNFGDTQSAQNESTEKSPAHTFNTAGTYTVTLTIANAADQETFTESVTIGTNELLDNRIVLSSGKLNSFRSAAGYQWYKDGALIEGATERAFNYTGQDGVYTVVTKSQSCNRVSEPYVVTALEGRDLADNIQLYPNPTDQSFKILMFQQGRTTVKITDRLGKSVLETTEYSTEIEIPSHTLLSGIYVVSIIQGNRTWTKKLIKR